MNPSNVGQGFFGVKVSKPGVDVNQANPQDLVYQSDYSSTIYYDNNNSRIVEGLLPDGSYGFWVSKPNQNANDPLAAVNNNLIFNSSQDIFKVLLTGIGTIPGLGNQSAFATGTQSLAIPHNLGYSPSFQCFANVNQASAGVGLPTRWNQQLPTFADDASGMTYNLQCGSDSTNLYVVNYWSNNSNIAPVDSFAVTYYIFTSSA